MQRQGQRSSRLTCSLTYFTHSPSIFSLFGQDRNRRCSEPWRLFQRLYRNKGSGRLLGGSYPLCRKSASSSKSSSSKQPSSENQLEKRRKKKKNKRLCCPNFLPPFSDTKPKKLAKYHSPSVSPTWWVAWSTNRVSSYSWQC